MGCSFGSALFGYVDGVQLRAGGEAVHALLYGATILAVVVAVLWAARRHWRPARGRAGRRGGRVRGVLVDRRRCRASSPPYAPQLVTLLVLAVASQRLRPPAADRAGVPAGRR